MVISIFQHDVVEQMVHRVVKLSQVQMVLDVVENIIVIILMVVQEKPHVDKSSINFLFSIYIFILFK